jgi:hypothetical protein
MLRAAREHRAQLSKELSDLAALLEFRQVCPDVGPLRAAASQCSNCGGDHWQYDITGLLIPLPHAVVTLPAGTAGVSCRLNVRVHGFCSSADGALDPMDRLSITLILDTSVAASQHRLLQSWHFDRHIGDKQANFAHPRYHFQHGGGQLQQHANNCGLQFFDGLVFLESPRIAHPPLDGVLAVDFIISNFGGPQWIALRSDITYLRLVAQAQARNWLPYTAATSSHWPKPKSPRPWSASDIWPQLD